MGIAIDNFKAVVAAVSEVLSGYGFEKMNESLENADGAQVSFSGEKGSIKLSYAGEKVQLFVSEEIDAEEFKKPLVASLLPTDGDDRDIKYVISELSESLNEQFAVKKQIKRAAQKTPQTVSKTAVKNGSFYDANTLASKLCLVFPELREAYRANIAKYGEFLGEEFFIDYGTERVIGAIKQNQPQTMKKMFQILNDIYEDGTNDTQSLIAVTILGELNNDQILLARCVDYMSETMAPTVIEVNKFLATGAGKKARKKLLDPPAYKPKKKKKPGMLAQMMSGGGGMTPPPAI